MAKVEAAEATAAVDGRACGGKKLFSSLFVYSPNRISNLIFLPHDCWQRRRRLPSQRHRGASGAATIARRRVPREIRRGAGAVRGGGGGGGDRGSGERYTGRREGGGGFRGRGCGVGSGDRGGGG